MVTPVSYPFETVIETSKQLLYGVRPEQVLFVCSEGGDGRGCGGRSGPENGRSDHFLRPDDPVKFFS